MEGHSDPDKASERVQEPFAWWRWLSPALWAGFIFALSSRSDFPRPSLASAFVLSIVAHFVLFAVLALLVYWAHRPRPNDAMKRGGIALFAAGAYAMSDELYQAFVPGRQASLFDIAVDLAGALSALLLMSVVEHRRDQRRTD